MKAINSACIIGAGTIGSLFAGHLGAVIETSVLVRRQEHADALNKQGLRLSGKSERPVRVRASVHPEELGDADLVIVATKASAVEDSVRRIDGHFSDARVMTVQNGLGCEALVAGHGSWPIISAVTFMSGVRHSDVHVEYELDTATWMGPWAQGSATIEEVRQVAELIRKAGLKAEAFPDLLPAQWSKLIFNSVINSVAAILDLPHVRAFAARDNDTDLGHLIFAMIEEGKAVARARGIALYEDPWEMNLEAVHYGQTGAEDYAHVPSMLDDVRAERATEIDWITGAIVREAREAGVPAPINETLYRLVKAREASWAPAGPDK